MPHSIRLGYPWHLTNQKTDQLGFRRNFNCPTGLVPEQTVWLVVDCAKGVSLDKLSLNGRVLSTSEKSRSPDWFSVGGELLTSNQLEIELSCPANPVSDQCQPAGRLDRIDLSNWASVRLEIETMEQGRI